MIKRFPLILRLMVLFVLQAGILGWMIWDRAQILENGQTVRLAVEPVDPRDIFRGYYVTLNYEISQISPSELDSEEQFEKHDIAYVTLAEGEDDNWHPIAISHTQPTSGSGETVIAGRVRHLTSPRRITSSDGEVVCSSRCQRLTIRYGIEQYFAQQDAAQKIETAQRGNDVEILAAIEPSGTAAIKGIIVDGTLRYEEPLL